MFICQNILFIILLLKFVFYNQYPSCSESVCDPSQIPRLPNTHHVKIELLLNCGYSRSRATEAPSHAPSLHPSLTLCQVFRSPGPRPLEYRHWENPGEKQSIKLYHRAYSTVRLTLFPNLAVKLIWILIYIPSLKTSDKIQASKIVFANMIAGKTGPAFRINTYCVRTAGWWGSRDKGMSDSPTGCFLPEQPLWNHGNTGELHLKTKITKASAWTLHL